MTYSLLRQKSILTVKLQLSKLVLTGLEKKLILECILCWNRRKQDTR